MGPGHTAGHGEGEGRGGVFYRDLKGRFSLSSVKSSLENRAAGTSLFPYLGAGPQRGVVRPPGGAGERE